MSIAVAVGLLTAASVYLFMQRGMVRIVLGFVLVSHAANLIIFAAGNSAYRAIPYVGAAAPEDQADPLPQAFVLTAIVIAFSITMFMVTLAITTTTDDDTETEEESPVKVLTSSMPTLAAPRSDEERDGESDRGAADDIAAPHTSQLPAQQGRVDGARRDEGGRS